MALLSDEYIRILKVARIPRRKHLEKYNMKIKMKILKGFNNITFYKSQQSILTTLDIIYQLQQNTAGCKYLCCNVFMFIIFNISLFNDGADSKNNAENDEQY